MMEKIQMESLLQFDKDPPESLDTLQTPLMLAVSTKVIKHFFFFKGLLKIHCIAKENTVILSCIVWDFITPFASLMYMQSCLSKPE